MNRSSLSYIKKAQFVQKSVGYFLPELGLNMGSSLLSLSSKNNLFFMHESNRAILHYKDLIYAWIGRAYAPL